jgi:RimJ/RimL family protein N-acetyltransferase
MSAELSRGVTVTSNDVHHNSPVEMPAQQRVVSLRAFREEDLANLAIWWIHDDVMAMQTVWPVPQPRETLIEMFRAWGRNDPTDDSCALAVDVDGSLSGYVAVLGLRSLSRTGELVVMLAPETHGRGLGRIVMNQLIKLAFTRLDMHRLEVRVFSFNSRAIRLYSSLGFHEEGRLRERILHDGRRHDEVVMGMLRHEWTQRTKDDPQ